MEDLERYLDEYVEPTIEDFQKNPTSRRHAFLACVALFHSIDYLAFPRRSRTIRQQFRSDCADFALIDRVAHAFKHVIAGNSDQKLTATEVISRPPAFYGTAVFDLSRWDDQTGGVTLNSDRDIDLLEAIRGATNFLRNQIVA